ncbi:MAG: methyltransferase domain-containing protein [Flavobacteriaceae bacterium]|nr:MAG: methyltransferase domain-containing protein [Flavobacteriaceae bacterium]
MKPVIYKGGKLPFKDNEFDIVQLITVLHHIKDPEETIKEAVRVGKKIIIMEDIYTSKFQKYITFIADSINNWEFIGHPHTNKTDLGWKQVFNKNNLKIEKVKYYNFLLFFKQVTYILTK